MVKSFWDARTQLTQADGIHPQTADRPANPAVRWAITDQRVRDLLQIAQNQPDALLEFRAITAFR
jgi:hypothetical protein